MPDSTHPKNNPPDKAHAYVYHNVEASLRHATSLVNFIHRRLTIGRFALSAVEAATLHAQLEELELLVGAVRWQVQEQQR